MAHTPSQQSARWAVHTGCTDLRAPARSVRVTLPRPSLRKSSRWGPTCNHQCSPSSSIVSVQGCQSPCSSWHSTGTLRARWAWARSSSSCGVSSKAGIQSSRLASTARRGGGFLQRDHGGGGASAGLPRFNNPRGVQVPLFSARVLVSLRPSVLDPAGEATRAAAARLGVDGVSRLRIGKAVEVEPGNTTTPRVIVRLLRCCRP